MNVLAFRPVQAALLCAVTASTIVAVMPPAAAERPAGPTRSNDFSATSKRPATTPSEVRDLLGLASDDGAVRRPEGDASATERFHIKVTQAEAREVDRKSELAQYGGGVAHRLKNDPTFGGAWIDFRTGELNFAFTNAHDGAEAARIRQEAPGGSSISVHESRRSLRTLLETQERLAAQQAELAAAGVHVVGVSLSQPADQLTVIVPQDEVDAAVAELSDRWGAEASVFQVKPDIGSGNDLSRDRSTGRVYGGLWLSFASGGPCTSSIANAQSTVTAADHFVITAGHCAPLNSAAYFGRYSSNRSPLTKVFRNKYVGGTTTTCDCMLIGPFAVSSPRLSSDVLVNNNAIYDYQRAGVPANGDYLVGTPACLSGAASVEQYGVIYCLNIYDPFAQKTTSAGVTLKDMVLMNGRSAQGGDSGGPWGNGRTYLGIHQGYLSNADMFSKASNLSVLNVRLRFDYGW